MLLAERLQRRHELFVRVLQHSLHLVFDLERNEWLNVCRESKLHNLRGTEIMTNYARVIGKIRQFDHVWNRESVNVSLIGSPFGGRNSSAPTAKPQCHHLVHVFKNVGLQGLTD